MPNDPASRLAEVLAAMPAPAIAVSGGVDSMTLSSFAHRRLGAEGVRMVHALSPAVPAAATARVRDHAARQGWALTEVDAGEFADPRYRANPVDRCFFCKTNLYGTLSRLADGTVLSGTNTDDLGDYRPGLKAAADHAVRHPYVEAGMAKADVRTLARDLGLADLAELPASPCLSSRVETGIRIEAPQLALIDAIESQLQRSLSPDVVRCRLRAGGLVIELDPETMDGLSDADRRAIAADVQARQASPAPLEVRFEAYRRGSAFVGAKITPAA